MGTSKQPTVHFVSLGCPKNRVDSEVMLGHLVQSGYHVVDRPEDAQIIVINTCGFIDTAKEESVDVILDMAQFKAQGLCKKLVVAGCLSQRYAPELAKEIPEVDLFLGTGNIEKIVDVLGNKQNSQTAPKPRSLVPELSASDEGPLRERGQHTPKLLERDDLVPYRHKKGTHHPKRVHIVAPKFTMNANSPRISSVPTHVSYVKVAEGCSNTCSFCAIPVIRGPQCSRPIEDVVAEVSTLADQGCVEFNLVAQDLCAYGKDLERGQNLSLLLSTLNTLGKQLDHPFWIRCLYTYPRGLNQRLIDTIARCGHVIPYLDIPLQHISDKMLRLMRRGKSGSATRQLICGIRKAMPNMTLRTTLMTGFPGETEDDFQELLDFVKAVQFERLGVFVFSIEEDTEAAALPNRVPPDVAMERREKLLAIQQEISYKQQQALIGQTLDVLVDGVAEETELLLQGRHVGQAPDIDGITYINSGTASPGEVVRVRIEQAHHYDLVGGIVDSEDAPRLRLEPSLCCVSKQPKDTCGSIVTN